MADSIAGLHGVANTTCDSFENVRQLVGGFAQYIGGNVGISYSRALEMLEWPME